MTQEEPLCRSDQLDTPEKDLQCTPTINKSKYIWFTGAPVFRLLFRYLDNAALKDYCLKHSTGHVYFFADTFFRDLPKKSNGRIEIHVLYRYVSGNSHDEDWENNYYRVHGSRRFDDFLRTIPENELYVSNYVGDINDADGFKDLVRGVYCTLGNIRFILMSELEELELTVTGDDPKEFMEVVRTLGLQKCET